MILFFSPVEELHWIRKESMEASFEIFVAPNQP